MAYVACMLRSSIVGARPRGMPWLIIDFISPALPSAGSSQHIRIVSAKCSMRPTKHFVYQHRLCSARTGHLSDVCELILTLFGRIGRTEHVTLVLIPQHTNYRLRALDLVRNDVSALVSDAVKRPT